MQTLSNIVNYIVEWVINNLAYFIGAIVALSILMFLWMGR